MRAGRVKPAQRVNESREILGYSVEIVDRVSAAGAWEPLVYRPLEWIGFGRLASCHLDRDGKRQVWSEPREPSRLFLRLVRRPPDARQSRYQLIAQSIDVVVGPVRLDRDDR